MNTEMINYLENYNGPSNFVMSLKDQYKRRGSLSLRQIEVLEKMLAPKTYCVNVGERVLLSRAVAERISQSLEVDFTHRGFEILAVHHETERAVLVDVRFSATRTVACCVCGITLSNEISRSIGIGPVCAEKHGIPYERNAFNLLQAKLEAVPQVAQKVWIPKYSIKEIEGTQPALAVAQ